MDSPFPFASRIFLLMEGVRTDLRPNLVPFATVRASPAFVRSINISRFHSSRTPISFIIIRPWNCPQWPHQERQRKRRRLLWKPSSETIATTFLIAVGSVQSSLPTLWTGDLKATHASSSSQRALNEHLRLKKSDGFFPSLIPS